MTAVPLQARIVWTAVVLAGLIVILVSGARAATEPIPWLSAVLLLVASTAFQRLRVQYSYRRTRNSQFGTVASAVYLASLLLLSPALAVTVNAAAFALTSFQRRGTWYKELFNVAQYALAIGLAGWVWHRWGSGSGVLLSVEHVFWLLVTLAIYFLINTGLVSLIVALIDHLPVRYVWLRSHRGILPAYCGMLFAGVLVAVLWSISPWSALLAVVPLIAIFYGFKNAIDLEQQTLSALFELADILDQRDYYTHQHSVRVGEEAEKLALRLGAPADEAHQIFLCGRLHDIGKCAISNEVLLKPGPLTPEEREHMVRHAAVGGQMLANFGIFRVGAGYVRGHHERFDGTGYPDGLKGEEIPFGARVIAVADAYDAMTTTRPYRQALPHQEAVRRLRAGRGTQWDPAIVAAYLELLEERHPSAASVSAVVSTRTDSLVGKAPDGAPALASEAGR